MRAVIRKTENGEDEEPALIPLLGVCRIVRDAQEAHKEYRHRKYKHKPHTEKKMAEIALSIYE